MISRSLMSWNSVQMQLVLQIWVHVGVTTAINRVANYHSTLSFHNLSSYTVCCNDIFKSNDKVLHAFINICTPVFAGLFFFSVCFSVHLSFAFSILFVLKVPLFSLLFYCVSFSFSLLSAIAQWTHFKQTQHRLYINKQITSFIFPVGCQTC